MSHKKNISFINQLLKYKTKKGFTFIELIVAITILTILSVLGFVSYKSHISSSRDAARTSELSDIYTLLDGQKIKSVLPIPDKKIDIYSSGILLGYQGYLSDNIIKKIGFKGTGKDPIDDVFYTYYLTKDLRSPGVLGFLENNPKNDSFINNKYYSFINKTYAVDYTDRYPVIFGKKLGILIDENNSPIQENATLQQTGALELSTLTANYIAYFDEKTSISNSGFSLDVLYGTTTTGMIGTSCEQYIEEFNGEILRSGYYLINSSTGIYEIYCDMTGTSGTGTTRIAICSGSLPPNTYAINGNTFIQTYDGIDWLPDSITWSHTGTSCVYECLDTHSWSGALNTCVQKINGVCGSDHMQNLITPPVSLCALGNPSAVTQPTPGTWPWVWTCNGINGGTTASCKTTDYCMVGGFFPCTIY